MRNAVLKQLPVNIPMLTHRGPAIKLGPAVVITYQSAVVFYRRGQGLFLRHMIYIYPPRVCFRANIPMFAHRFYAGKDIAAVVYTRFVVNGFHNEYP